MSVTRGSIRILAFGDSLTEGYYCRGYKFHPYALKLQSLLDAKHSPKQFEIVNEGISGDTTANMVHRMSSALKQAHYDYAIVLGGTNDLGYNWESITDNLKNISEQLLAKGVKSALMSIPEHGQERAFPEIEERRKNVNKWLREFASSRGITFIDLAAKIPQLDVSPEERKKYWDDQIHFTPAGYDRIGELIFEEVFSS
eukprot:TRINITY_DN6518_c0_g1_i1.p1 TRINITY_DN6518_c0_g1~~TRINITY_DN6518_c0_g1_i1.p1  ORF type:complete len:233 (-),score=22.02 TRINITY_DN6518_c0_g1_i1:83-679(-)